MQILKHISLQPYHTFGIEVYAKQFVRVDSFNALQNFITSLNEQPIFVLGGGSNMLFTKNIEACVIKNEIKGIEKIAEDELFVYVKVGAGENWHHFVLHCLHHNWAGVENLSLIPGTVGASPIQNIGAYGVELKEVFHSLTALHIKDNKATHFSLADCCFGYRESIFKHQYKNQFIITQVTFRLRKQPVFTIQYGAIAKQLKTMQVETLSIKAISDAVIAIRSSKLPDPRLLGNAGSFFKNPTITNTQFELLKQAYPAIPGYVNTNQTVKLAAGWLIEQCGWKGYRNGDAGCYELQALVLVNYGQASGSDIYELSNDIIQSVQSKFSIRLEREVNIL
jgi:UDP-N-acetylmuramate dehydrogenase